MALDTRNKRASALREGLLPLPDGAPFTEADRAQILWQYAGTAVDPPGLENVAYVTAIMQ